MNSTVIENLEAAILQLSNSEKNATRMALNSDGNTLKKASIEIGYLQAEIDSVKFRLEAVLHVIKVNTNEG